MYLFLILFFITVSMFSQVKETITLTSESKKNDASPIIAFSIIDEAPIFPGCESLHKSERKKCMNLKIQRHVGKNFDTEEAKCLKKEFIYNKKTHKKEEKCTSELSAGKKRIYLQFIISTTGNIENVKARASHNKLKEEGIRVIKLLPKMVPGKLKNKPVKVSYTLPITFNLED